MVTTEQVLKLDETTTITDMGEVVSTLKLEKIAINLKEFQHIKDVVAPGDTYTVDFDTISPTYAKIVVKGVADLKIGVDDLQAQTTSTIVKDVQSFEINGVVTALELTNQDTTNAIDIDIIIAQE